MKKKSTLDQQERFILLKITRQYEKDESIAFLLTTIKKLQNEIGVLKSEAAEADHLRKENAGLKTEIACFDKFPGNNPSKRMQKVNDLIYDLTKENERLRSKILSCHETTPPISNPGN